MNREATTAPSSSTSTSNVGAHGDANPTLELYWIPLGADSPTVQVSGRVYERIVSTIGRRRPRALFHAALIARNGSMQTVVEVAPIPDDDGRLRRGVVAEGPVGSRLLGRWRLFRYEVRRWSGGSIPDLHHAVESPVTITKDTVEIATALDRLADVPTPVWGRDELGLGEMWNSNSVVAWLLTSTGLMRPGLAPPSDGRAPGWEAGIAMATNGTLDDAGRSPGRPDPPIRDRRIDVFDAPEHFDHASLDGLPDPAARFLRHALPDGVTLARSVEIEAHGSIKLGNSWWPFRSTQVLRAGEGLVWRPVVRRGPMRVTGADTYVDGVGTMEFRLFGLIPVARASGADTDRSAAGRLAAETVAWLPHATTPQAGAEWSPLDDDRARVTIETPAGPIAVDITVDADGRLVGLRTMRWNGSESPPSEQPFGGQAGGEYTTGSGVRILGRGGIGWGWETGAWPEGEFFRFEVTSARHR